MKKSKEKLEQTEFELPYMPALMNNLRYAQQSNYGDERLIQLASDLKKGVKLNKKDESYVLEKYRLEESVKLDDTLQSELDLSHFYDVPDLYHLEDLAFSAFRLGLGGIYMAHTARRCRKIRDSHKSSKRKEQRKPITKKEIKSKINNFYLWIEKLAKGDDSNQEF